MSRPRRARLRYRREEETAPRCRLQRPCMTPMALESERLGGPGGHVQVWACPDCGETVEYQVLTHSEPQLELEG